MEKQQNYLIIKGTKYTLEFFKESRNYSGETNFIEKTVSVEALQSKYELKKIIYHELLHAYFYECGLIQYAKDETLVYFLENMLFEILDNLDLATEIYKKGLKK